MGTGQLGTCRYLLSALNARSSEPSCGCWRCPGASNLRNHAWFQAYNLPGICELSELIWQGGQQGLELLWDMWCGNLVHDLE